MRKFKTKLTDQEVKDLVRLLKKVRLPVPYPVFIALCKSVPLIAVDLLLVNNKNQVLVTYRKDEFYDGWHIPGSILRYKEKVEDAYTRVAREELGLKQISNVKFERYFSYLDAREHGIVLLFTARSKERPKDGKYFSLDNLPKTFLKCQNAEIEYLRNNLNLV